jgi:hypothetical protein
MHGVIAANTMPTPPVAAVASRKSVYASVADDASTPDMSMSQRAAYDACNVNSSATPAIRPANVRSVDVSGLRARAKA